MAIANDMALEQEAVKTVNTIIRAKGCLRIGIIMVGGRKLPLYEGG